MIPGQALFALGVLVFVLAWMQANFDPREIWERIEWAEAGARRSLDGVDETPPQGAS